MNKKQMHICWVLANNSSAPYFNWFAEQAKNNSDIKLSFVCLHSEKPKMIDDMQKYGYNCFWIKYDCHQRKRGLIRSTFKLYSLFRKIKPDIVHSHLFDDSIASLIASKIAFVKRRIITKGDTGFHYYYTPKWVVFDKLNNFLATDIIAISEESKRMIIEKEKANLKKINLIHHGIPIESATSQMEDVKNKYIEKWQLRDKIVVGTIARFIEWKGYIHIVNAAEKLIQNNPLFVFLFVGNGEQKDEIRNLVAQKKIEENFIFADWIIPEDIPSLFGLMNVYLHAAKYEPFGLVIVEAMLNGIPVVSSNTGSAADSIEHKKSGYICNYDSLEKEFIDGITFILKNNTNNCIGNEGQKVAEKMFSINEMYNKHIALYFSKIRYFQYTTIKTHN